MTIPPLSVAGLATGGTARAPLPFDVVGVTVGTGVFAVKPCACAPSGGAMGVSTRTGAGAEAVVVPIGTLQIEPSPSSIKSRLLLAVMLVMRSYTEMGFGFGPLKFPIASAL